jgi:outer membrane protein OmpA-like peptidoglycan-associated protein
MADASDAMLTGGGTEADAAAPADGGAPAYALPVYAAAPAYPVYSGPPLHFPGFEVGRYGKIELGKPLHFETDAPRILPESEAVLRRVVRLMEASPQITLLQIVSLGSMQGSREHSRELARVRALSVSAWLVAHGVDCHRLLPVAFGPNHPGIAERVPARELRHRIELRVALVDGAFPYGPLDTRGQAGDPCAP